MYYVFEDIYDAILTSCPRRCVGPRVGGMCVEVCVRAYAGAIHTWVNNLWTITNQLSKVLDKPTRIDMLSVIVYALLSLCVCMCCDGGVWAIVCAFGHLIPPPPHNYIISHTRTLHRGDEVGSVCVCGFGWWMMNT